MRVLVSQDCEWEQISVPRITMPRLNSDVEKGICQQRSYEMILANSLISGGRSSWDGHSRGEPCLHFCGACPTSNERDFKRIAISSLVTDDGQDEPQGTYDVFIERLLGT